MDSQELRRKCQKDQRVGGMIYEENKTTLNSLFE